MTVLIDGDSLFYILAWNYRDVEPDPMSINDMYSSIRSFLDMIVTLSHADSYYGFIGDVQRGCFRHQHYKYATYKGNRPPKSEWLIKWEPHIRMRLLHYGFTSNADLEADDLICGVSEELMKSSESFIIASPDKDMKQIPGLHMDYKKEVPEITSITTEKAFYNLVLQTIAGDSNDNVFGVPGLGPVKAAKLLEAANDPVEYWSIAKQAYYKYFGPYYGPMIFAETRMAIELMSTNHPLYNFYGGAIVRHRKLNQHHVSKLKSQTPSIFE